VLDQELKDKIFVGSHSFSFRASVDFP